MAVLAPPVQVVASGAPPFVHVASGAPPFVVTTGPAPPIMVVASGAPPITLFNADGSIWAGGGGPAVGGAALLTGETAGFAADFTHAVDAERVAVKTAGTVVASGLSFFTNAGVSSKWAYDVMGTLVNVAAGSLALDYDPVTHAAKGLLVEPAGTNLLLRSSEFGNAVWTKELLAITADAIAAPDGTTTADTFTPAASTGRLTAYSLVTGISAADTTFSCFVKKINGKYITLSIGTGSFYVSATFDLDAVSTTQLSAVTWTGQTSAIQALSDGWFRLSVTATTTAGSHYVLISYSHVGTFTPDAYGANAGTTSPGTAAYYVWGAQIETGAVATSYIPTIAATVTRAADQVNVTPASIGHSATAGSWWAEWSAPAVITNGRVIGNTSASAPLLMGSNSVGILDGTTLSKSLTWAVNTTHRAVSAYASGDRAVTLNGAAVAADAGAVTNLLAPGAAIYFGNGGSTPMNGRLRKVRYLPTRPTNAQLVTDTT